MGTGTTTIRVLQPISYQVAVDTDDPAGLMRALRAYLTAPTGTGDPRHRLYRDDESCLALEPFTGTEAVRVIERVEGGVWLTVQAASPESAAHRAGKLIEWATA
jgi:hypothetical protein